MTNEKNDHDLLIELNTKVDGILEGLLKMDSLEVRIRDLEVDKATGQTEIKTLKSEVDRLRTMNTALSVFNGILTVVGLIFVYLVK